MRTSLLAICLALAMSLASTGCALLFVAYNGDQSEDGKHDLGSDTGPAGDLDTASDADADADTDTDADADADADGDTDADSDTDADHDSCSFAEDVCLESNEPDNEAWCTNVGGDYSLFPCPSGATGMCLLDAGGDFTESAIVYYYNHFPGEEGCEGAGGTYIPI